ncbi:UbiA-like polyprenyltransferase [Desulfatiferula olefinivorans]
MKSHSATGLLSAVTTYGRMIKFSHTIFALPFALVAVILAGRDRDIHFPSLIWILLAMVGARSAAMGFNRLVDAAIDGQNPRTRMREIPAGVLSRTSALVFIVLSSALFILSAAMLGDLCFYLSLPVLALLFGYSYTKRFTALCHLYLGCVIALSPMGAYIALTNTMHWGIVFLSLALLTNIAGFDILYACQDTDFDKEKGLYSIPAVFGVRRALALSTLLHVLTFVFFLLVHTAVDMGPIYLITTAIIGVLLIIEHRLVKPDDLRRVPIAFFHINSILSVVLITGVALNEWLRL